MLLNVKQLSKEDIDYLKFSFDIDIKKNVFVPMVTDDFKALVNGECKRENDIITINYRVNFGVNYNCDRCLGVSDKDFNFSFNHIIDENKLSYNEDYNVFLNNGLFNLTSLIESDIMLEFPHKLLCKEDCNGVCSKCGVNKNKGNCSCELKDIDPRMKVLEQLLK